VFAARESKERLEFVLEQQISILVNGIRRDAAAGETVSGLLRRLEIASERVAVELNKEIVRKRDWERTAVPPGAEIEVVEFVGGG
jgi:sulfur carrier protein